MKLKSKIDIGLKDQLENYHPVDANPDWGAFKNTYDRFLKEKARRKRIFRFTLGTALIIILSGILAISSIQNKKGEISSTNKKLTKQENIKDIKHQKNQTKPETIEDFKILKEQKHVISEYNTPASSNNMFTKNAKKTYHTKENTVKESEPGHVTEWMNKLLVNSFPLKLNAFTKSKAKKSFLSEKQKKDIQNSLRFKTSLSFNTNLNYSFYDLILDNETTGAFHEDYKSLIKNSEKPGYSFSIGAQISYYINKSFSLNSGIYYSSFSQQLNYNYTNHKIPVIDSVSNQILGYIYDTTGTYLNLSYTNHNKFIEIPLILDYNKPISNRWCLHLRSGGSVFYQLAPNSYRLIFDELTLKEDHKEDVNTWNLGITFAIGLEYRLSDQLSLSLEPNYKKLFYSRYKEENYNQKLYTYGITTKLELFF